MKGLCHKCYRKKYDKLHRTRINKQHREQSYTTTSRRQMSENKKCTLFLGVHVAEQVLSKVFKDIQEMPPCNPGYDFTCNQNKKIDVKSSCARINKLGRRTWGFKINHNTIADYFLCITFDNRNDLNPLHIWLIPGNVLNHSSGITISESRIGKWDKYKLDINKVTACCNTLKDKSTKE